MPQLCAKYEGCRSAATTGSLTVVVFDTAAAAKEYGSSTAGEDVEKSGGRRYWLLVDYRKLSPDEQSAWRDFQREVIP